MTDSPAFRVLADVVRKLTRLRIDYALGGSMASGVWGQPRYTNDLDFNIALSEEQSTAFVDAFAGEYVIEPSEVNHAVKSCEPYRMVQALHVEDAFKIDFFLVGDEAFGRSVLQRARPVELAPGVSCLVQSPEDVLLYKLRWYELGNRVSERQWNDVVQVLEVQLGQLDLDYLRRWAKEYGIDPTLEAALTEATVG